MIRESVKVIPGVDGRKMSKSYDNEIPIFAPQTEIKKRVMRIVTDSLRPEDSKDPDQCNVFNIFRHFAARDRVAQRAEQYRRGGVGYGEMKEELLQVLEGTFAAKRERYDALVADPKQIDVILQKGANNARQIGGRLMEKVRKKLGVAAR
jgi:tryptophanyl-tRNA synthetase